MLSKMYITWFLALITISTVASIAVDSADSTPPRYLSKRREQFRVIYEWNALNFTWPSDAEYQKAVNNSEYIPKNVLISGIKVYNDKIYLTLPRLKEGVPATMAWIKAVPMENDTSPPLNPFPSFEKNKIGSCEGFQSVQNFEIDLTGLMWVIDNGKSSTMKPNTSTLSCMPSLTLIDLNTEHMTRYVFPTNVAGPQSYLNDIVIDDTDGGYAYITDNSGADPGIIVFSRKENLSWKFKDSGSMLADIAASHFSINGTEKTMSINIDGIALGPRFIGNDGQVDRILYFSPLSSFKLFMLPTSILRNQTLSNMPASTRVHNIKVVGTKSSQTDGMIMDEEGVLYYGLIGDYAIAQWDSRTNFSANQEIIAKDRNFIQWIDRFAFDTMNNLHVVINRLHNFVADKVNIEEVNYRILRTHVGTKSYLYSPMLLPAVKSNQPPPNTVRIHKGNAYSGAGVAASAPLLSMILCVMCVLL